MYSSGESAELVQALTSNLASGKEAIDQLKSGSHQVVAAIDGHTLAGAAYSAGKGLFRELIIPTITRASTAFEAIEQELQQYKSADQTISSEGYLNEDLLKQQIVTKKAMKASIDFTSNMARTTASGNPTATILDSLLNFQRSLARMSGDIQNDIDQLNRKLEKLHNFSSQTNSLFNSSLNDLMLTMQRVLVLNETIVNNDGTYTLPAGVDKSWFTALKSKDEMLCYEKSREAFLKKEQEYKKIFNLLFETRKDGTIKGVKDSEILKLLADVKLTDAEKDVLMFYLHYKLSNLIDSGSTVAQFFVQNPLLETIADRLELDLSYLQGLDSSEFKNELEGSLYNIPGLNSFIKDGLSFEYNAKEDYYYTNESGMQSHFGFGDMYDHFAYPLGMDLDTSVYDFELDGKEYRLQLWKGTYGVGQAYGAEQGWYVRDVNESLSTLNQVGEVFGGNGWQPTADEANQIRMRNETYSSTTEKMLVANDTKKENNGASNGTHYWNLAIKTDPNQNKSNLYNKGTLYIQDKDIRDALVRQMSQDGSITDLKNNADGTVTYTWGK